MVIKKRKKERDFGDYVDEGLSYLKDSLNYVYFAIFIFFVSGILGFIFSEKLTFIDAILSDLISQIQGLGPLGLIVFILLNNAQSALFSLILGLIFGIFPVFNAVANGAVLGYVMSSVYEISGFSQFWRILPHGIFELPAIFISLGLGIKLGMFVFERDRGRAFRERLTKSVIVFLTIVLPLLILAAVIEGLLIFYGS